MMQRPGEGDLLMMRVAEVARRLDVSAKTVYSLLEGGRLRCYRVGNGRGSYRVTEEHLRDYLEGVAIGGAIATASQSTPGPPPAVAFRHRKGRAAPSPVGPPRP